MREFENNAVFVGEEDFGLTGAVVHVEMCDDDRAETVGHAGRLYRAANTTGARDAKPFANASARFRASLWLAIAADIRRRAKDI